MKIIAIDPGNVESAYIFWNGKKIMGRFDKVPNEELVDILWETSYDKCIIERIASYGMSVGETTFETVWWSGRFGQISICRHIPVGRIKRIPIKMHLCHNPHAKDSNVIQALADRFSQPGTGRLGKGTKKEPGFFYGFYKDIWQAFAVAVVWYDQQEIGIPI